MTPSIGRVVHFNTLRGETVPAIVAAVITETELVLYVMDPKDGAGFKNANITESGEPLRWNWMPYQVQMAGKDLAPSQTPSAPVAELTKTPDQPAEPTPPAVA